jgi:cell division protein ZapE
MSKIKLDNTQTELYKKIEEIAKIHAKNQKISVFSQVFGKKPQKIKSIYIQSAPGRGKTMIMRKFYDNVKIPKAYFHFNDFMYQIHQNLHEIRSKNKFYEDELIQALKMTVKNAKIICFDEFQVHDIADAMILGRIFTYFFSSKILLIITSNTKPQDLYKNGLQRELFMQFVNNILLKNIEIVKLDDKIDYRTQFTSDLNIRYFVKNYEKIAEIIKNHTKESEIWPRTIKIWGRELQIKQSYKNIAIINYTDLCQEKHSASDYRAICKEFSLIFLLNLPILTKNEKDELKRLMLFIDEVYENKVALIILAESEIEKIYKDCKDDNSFNRAISRLKEIKSDHYFNNSKFKKIC